MSERIRLMEKKGISVKFVEFDRLRGKLGDCLIDDPKNPPDKFKLPDMLAGAMYGADFQCDMQYPGSKMCTSHAVCMYMCIALSFFLLLLLLLVERF